MTERTERSLSIRFLFFTLRMLGRLLWWILRGVGKGAQKFSRWLVTHSGRPTLRESVIEITEKTSGRPLRKEVKERGHNPDSEPTLYDRVITMARNSRGKSVYDKKFSEGP